MVALQGTITKINRLRQMGEIKGDDGQLRRFERESMVRWMQFDELTTGTRSCSRSKAQAPSSTSNASIDGWGRF